MQKRREKEGGKTLKKEKENHRSANK